MTYKNIILTGATGVVGQHILFELLYNFKTKQINGKITLVTRTQKQYSAKERIQNLLTNSFAPDFLKNHTLEDLMQHIDVLDIDLTSPKINRLLNFSKEDNICVIHCAASTNLLSTDEAEQELKFSNYHATLNILNATSKFAKKFVFISTAFSCGVRKGFVDEDYLAYPQTAYRNPYEKYKALAEKETLKICQDKGIKHQILRPSIVCGRLLDSPLYYTPKYDVFYGYTKFFYKLMETPFANTTLRVLADPDRAVSNVIPVDYVAKAVVAAIDRDDIEQMNIAHSKSVPLSFSFPKMVELNGYKRYQIVDSIPNDLNMLEALYYAEVGNISSPYLFDDAFEFDTKTVRALLSHIEEPDVIANTDSIFRFAVAEQFKNT